MELARADVDDLSDDPEGAIKHLEEAVRIEQGRVGPEVIQRLVEALYGRGRYAEAAGYIACCGSRCWSTRRWAAWPPASP